MNLKKCLRCSDEKELSEFGKDKSRKDGLFSWCRKCTCENQKEIKRTMKGLANVIYSSQRQSSRERLYKYPDYTLEELREWLFSNEKYQPLFDQWVISGFLKSKTPSIDRIDDYRSYTLDNIQLMTWGENDEKARRDRRNGINNKASKSVIQLSIDGVFIKKYHSCIEAGRSTKIDRASICRCCIGMYSHAGEYRWKYA